MSRKTNGTCWNCWKAEHLPHQCPEPLRTIGDKELLRIKLNVPLPHNPKYNEALKSVKCFNCWGYGHSGKSCTEKRLSTADREKLRIKKGKPLDEYWRKVLKRDGVKVPGEPVDGGSAGDDTPIGYMNTWQWPGAQLARPTATMHPSSPTPAACRGVDTPGNIVVAGGHQRVGKMFSELDMNTEAAAGITTRNGYDNLYQDALPATTLQTLMQPTADSSDQDRERLLLDIISKQSDTIKEQNGTIKRQTETISLQMNIINDLMRKNTQL